MKACLNLTSNCNACIEILHLSVLVTRLTDLSISVKVLCTCTHLPIPLPQPQLVLVTCIVASRIASTETWTSWGKVSQFENQWLTFYCNDCCQFILRETLRLFPSAHSTVHAKWSSRVKVK